MEVMSKELIKPSSPTPPGSKELKLSLLDQLATSYFIPLIFFYQNEPLCSNSIDQAKRSQNLKHSLSEVLTKFYPLAGRLNGNVSIDCNDSGALFIEARVHAQLSQESIQDTVAEEPNQYLPFEPYDATISNKLLLGIQVSLFDCGGIAIGVCISHKVADTVSFVTFLNAWAAICRGQADEVVQPDCEIGGKLFPPLNIGSSSNDSPLFEKKETFVTKRFVFDKDKLAALQELASTAASHRSSVKDPTRVEAVSAFIWNQFIRVSEAKVDHEKIFIAYHAVNLRPRMNLPCDRFAFGNFSLVTSATLTRSDEQDDHDKGYRDDLVGLLRAAIRKINDDYIKNVQSGIPYLNILRNDVKEQLSKRPMACTGFTSWCRFPVYEVDYGWGKPTSVCTKPPPSKNFVILLSTSLGDGIEAWTNLAEDEMAFIPDELLSLASIGTLALQAKVSI